MLEWNNELPRAFHRRARDVAVTADNGELLGEGGRFSHGYGRVEPLLLEVPWFRRDHGNEF
ncbi:MAG: hypothetical protein JSV27_04460 [Candidatus Bathyarchaeota archaeon]|nr:MAG: hypothetical protein JSV27_04460 [Candidatus Bathyarchaeota archaeon]